MQLLNPILVQMNCVSVEENGPSVTFMSQFDILAYLNIGMGCVTI